MNPSFEFKGYRLATLIIALAVAGNRFGFAVSNGVPSSGLPTKDVRTFVKQQDNLEPLLYNVDLQIKQEGSGGNPTFSGKVDITLKLNKMNPFLFLHYIGNKARSLASRNMFLDEDESFQLASNSRADGTNPSNPSKQIAINTKGLKITRAYIKVAKTEAGLDEDNCRTIEAKRIWIGYGDTIALRLEGNMPADSYGKLTIFYEPSNSWSWSHMDAYGIKNENEGQLIGPRFVAFPHFEHHKDAVKVKIAASVDPAFGQLESRNMNAGDVESVPGSELKKYHFETSTDSIYGGKRLWVNFNKSN